jgi:hypothetical protein
VGENTITIYHGDDDDDNELFPRAYPYSSSSSHTMKVRVKNQQNKQPKNSKKHSKFK